MFLFLPFCISLFPHLSVSLEYTRVHVIVSSMCYILQQFVTFEFFEDVTLVLHEGVVVEEGHWGHKVTLLALRGVFG
jgi:hypothetical protein